jgi:hypothetical protein
MGSDSSSYFEYVLHAHLLELQGGAARLAMAWIVRAEESLIPMTSISVAITASLALLHLVLNTRHRTHPFSIPPTKSVITILLTCTVAFVFMSSLSNLV